MRSPCFQRPDPLVCVDFIGFAFVSSLSLKLRIRYDLSHAAACLLFSRAALTKVSSMRSGDFATIPCVNCGCMWIRHPGPACTVSAPSVISAFPLRIWIVAGIGAVCAVNSWPGAKPNTTSLMASSFKAYG